MKRAADLAEAFVDMVGQRPWKTRMAELAGLVAGISRGARAYGTRYQPELAIERLRRCAGEPSALGRALMVPMADLLRGYAGLPVAGRARLREDLRAALKGDATLVGPLHLGRTAALQVARGFAVDYARYADAAPFDLLISRQGCEAEIACDVISAEAGRDVHRGAWAQLVDRIDPDLHTWLASHPGRYLLKLTLPRGLRADVEPENALALLHGRIRDMLRAQRRADHDEAAVLRLDPLMLAGSQADELGFVNRLRREFGHEAHLAVTASRGGVFVMAARAGREDEIAVAMRRRLAALAPARLTGTRPGILAILVEDVDRAEWRHLRERLEIEGEARQFLTCPEARCVVAVTCVSRLELLGEVGPAAAPEGEMRFRNPSHPAAKSAGLAPAVMSSV